jgi:hypothetical protein
MKDSRFRLLPPAGLPDVSQCRRSKQWLVDYSRRISSACAETEVEKLSRSCNHCGRPTRSAGCTTLAFTRRAHPCCATCHYLVAWNHRDCRAGRWRLPKRGKTCVRKTLSFVYHCRCFCGRILWLSGHASPRRRGSSAQGQSEETTAAPGRDLVSHCDEAQELHQR